MALPVALENIIEQMHNAMLEDPAHHIPFLSCLGILSTMGFHENKTGDLAVGWLAVITAGHIMPVWERALPHDTYPHTLLALAEEYLTGKATEENALAHERVVKEFYQASNGSYETIPHAANNVLRTAYEALVQVLGEPSQGTWIRTAEVAVLEHDKFNTQEADSDPAKRQAFWEWWLDEAIPQAWDKATKGG